MVKEKVDRSTGEVVLVHVYPLLRSSYDDHMPMSNQTGLYCADESLADQSAAEEADINTIVKRFGLTGQLPENVRKPTYGDFTGLGSYQEALNAIREADESFYSMPAEIRAEFDNDPEKFVRFCSDDKNKNRVAELGMLSPEAFKRHQDDLAAEAERKFQAELDRRSKADLAASGGGSRGREPPDPAVSGGGKS